MVWVLKSSFLYMPWMVVNFLFWRKTFLLEQDKKLFALVVVARFIECMNEDRSTERHLTVPGGWYGA